ncbi:transposase [Companilactobacillus huachuanensis]|uniref:Transposase n=1 Tax=Companilactobacillus huachuanensis TaxID=2559914 RepID=A0ABW1RN87_9LACO|nr:transposase [Companilactobacillus huachuanensis]
MKIIGREKLVSQPSISRFFSIITSDNLDEFRQLLWDIAQLFFEKSNQRQFVVDLDSTHSDTFGRQESSAFNAHYMAYGYHPQVVLRPPFWYATGRISSSRK